MIIENRTSKKLTIKYKVTDRFWESKVLMQREYIRIDYGKVEKMLIEEVY